ncbi:MAG: glycoside hydrolase family 78 protein [Propionibacteriaceae bacterium]|jgi:alpha-L-rhamnosidase|nr:glycoside hydrolase family 78 protein [Propionibacteriaceae bacterium]
MAAQPSAPTVEHHREPFGIGQAQPRLSWTTVGEPDWRQAAYELEVELDGQTLRRQVTGSDQILVPWPGPALASRQAASVRVRLLGQDGLWTVWSSATGLETGLLLASDWTAQPVGGAWPERPHSDDRRPSLVRREFSVGPDLVAARLYASAHGLYEVEINGQRVGDDAMSPGWTPYASHLRYYTYDVTDQVRAGDNAIGAWLGDGWYRGRLGWDGLRDHFGSDLAFIGQLELTYADGRVETVATDATWRAGFGPILRTGNYDGEDYDARLERPGWSAPGFDDSDFTPVAVGRRDPATLRAPSGPPVRCTDEVAPLAVLTTPSGRQVVDFGQNLVGRPRIRVLGPAGATVSLRTAEVLQDGEICTRPLRTARSTDNYTLAGRPQGESWEPRFTFHGFRYLEVTGWPGDLRQAVAEGAIVARVYHSDLDRIGWFECSNELVNRLHDNVVWSMRGNFLDIPTDCPQRDERLGWTGDIQIFGPTAAFLYDVSGMLSGWLEDVAREQLPDGTVPWYVPVIEAKQRWTPIRPGAAWGDVVTFLPLALWSRSGDLEIVERQWESARRWVDLMDRLAGPSHLWDSGFQLGDWLDPAAPPDDPAAARTDRYLVASAFFAASTAKLAQMAESTGRAEEAQRYGQLAQAVRQAFAQAYVEADGSMTSDAQTAYALGLEFDLIPDQLRARAGHRLAELVHQDDNRIATGFVGTPLLCDALSGAGQLEAAYDLLLEEDCPSWLYPVRQGATTIWERWDAQTPDGQVNPGAMTSFNHYAFGAVADWLHRVVAGLAPLEPGYRRIEFRPRPGGTLSYASARHRSPYGLVAIAWRIVGDRLTVEAEVPLGADARLVWPGQEPIELGPGRHNLSLPWPPVRAD